MRPSPPTPEQETLCEYCIDTLREFDVPFEILTLGLLTTMQCACCKELRKLCLVRYVDDTQSG